MPRRGPLALLAIGLIAGLMAVLAMPLTPSRSLRVGAPSPRDFTAPRSQRFVSELRTLAEREKAAAAVAPAYQLDTRLEGVQRKRLGAVLENLGMLRLSPEPLESKRSWALGFPELVRLSPAAIDLLVGDGEAGLPETEWLTLADEAPRALGLAMRQDIRPEDLPAARREIMGMVDSGLDADLARLVGEVAAGFVMPNRLPDLGRIVAEQEEARRSTPAVYAEIQAGSTIVRKGDLITAESYEALQALGLLPRALDLRRLVSLALMLTALVLVLGAALYHLHPDIFLRPRALALIGASTLVFLFIARLTQPLHPLALYALPAPALGMTVAVVFSLGTGFISTLLLAIALGLLDGAGLGPLLYVLLGSLAGAVIMVRVARIKAFVWAGLSLCAINAALALAQALSGAAGPPELVLAASLGIVQALVATGLAALGIMAAGTLFGVTTHFHLFELMRPDQPLLRRLQTLAPGTYQHSVVLANLAETAATAIGADPLLARAGAYFHDVGKTARPAFFVENQMGAANPHDSLDPAASARIVIAHVTDGVALARQHRLPDRLVDFIREHHGTQRAEFFYRRALADAEALAAAAGEQGSNGAAPEPPDEAAFRYPGPRPQSKETAILLLADAAEAAVRAAEPKAPQEIETVVDKIIQARLAAGELDDSGLSLGEIHRVRASFIDTLRGMYHPRIRYPEGLGPQAPA